MYELPDAYRRNSPEFNVPTEGFGAISSWLTKDSRVVKSGTPLPAGVPLHDTHQWSFPVIYHRRASEYRCRTFQPAVADLFYIPAYNLDYGSDKRALPCVDSGQERLFARLHAVRDNITSYLARHNGHDHFRASPMPCASRALLE